MIDTDKMKVAFAATPLCQGAWTEKGDGDTPTKLCAISSLVSFAGVQPDLIAKMDAVETNAAYLKMYGWGSMRVPQWVATLAMPVLHAEYGIPTDIAASFPSIFDRQENEWRGVAEVLALCEQHNTAEMHTEAIAEDSFRFPQHGPEQQPVGLLTITQPYGVSWASNLFIASKNLMVWDEASSYTVEQHGKAAVVIGAKPKGETLTGQSKFWTASQKPFVPKKLVAFK